MDRRQPRISVCSPVHNEEANLRRLVREINTVMSEHHDTDWEQVLVDDGSSDGSGALMRELAGDSGRLRILAHPHNRGERAAWSTAFEHAAGEIVVMLAADLQNDPSDIQRLVDMVVHGEADCCTGARRRRKDGPFYWCATRVLNAYVRLVFGVPVRDASSSFFAVRRRFVQGLPLVHNDHRYILALIRRRGARIEEILTAHRPRAAGRSHYSRWKVPRALPEVLAFTWRLFSGFYDDHDHDRG